MSSPAQIKEMEGLREKLQAQQVIAEHMTQTCADLKYQLQALKKELEYAKSNAKEWEEISRNATIGTATEQAEVLDVWASELSALRDGVTTSLHHLRPLNPDPYATTLQLGGDDLRSLELGIAALSQAEQRLETWINEGQAPLRRVS